MSSWAVTLDALAYHREWSYCETRRRLMRRPAPRLYYKGARMPRDTMSKYRSNTMERAKGSSPATDEYLEFVFRMMRENEGFLYEHSQGL